MTLSITEYLERGPSTSKEIQAATGLSQSTVSRLLKKKGDSVIQLKRGRSTRYAATRNAFGGNDKLPLSMINVSGETILIAYIRPLNYGGFFVEIVRDFSPLLLGENEDGLYDDLPYFLYDLRPQGFLGRQIAHAIASQSDDFPSNPDTWTTNHIGRYLISNGDDLPGCFIFGEPSLLRVKRKPACVSDTDYPALAENVMNGDVPGSSAGGEQPKFTAFNGNLSSHVIVKFTPKGDNEIAARWRDILITEYWAAKIISTGFFPAAKPRLFDIDGRLFLETQRFDRFKEFGRLPMISLKVIDAEFVGLGNNWALIMRNLCKKNMVSKQDALDAQTLWHFGRLINNTDMHLGNLSLTIEYDSFQLLPVYDMCSMGFAPRSGGEVPPFSFKPLNIDKIDIDEEQLWMIKSLAHKFWDHVVNDDRISDQFRNFLQKGNPIDSLWSSENFV
ncbi:type II toxin-antitoxin system HipA family toxin YjjJ [Desulfobacula toluolica]|uniref:HipA domain protein n=1 Tax=Desulfobacula toluolica (strain DSM 7467 / Tol2) TaxID=651182 RepID=K0NN61_DESTT|nr:type II toxin-antitoxin system HipA family toxin YjjJ [Desulfobacula toluolica]CCK81448.1 HipA domain protein [Desulfobacula toluolica Tol2]